MSSLKTIIALLVWTLVLSAAPSVSHGYAKTPVSSTAVWNTVGSDGTDKKSQKKKSSKKKSSKKKKKKKKKPPVRFSGVFYLRFVYDDNFIHYSDEDLDQFTTQVNYGKFSIDTAHDWIVRPRIDFSVKSHKLTGKDLEMRLRYSAWRYANNPVKDNSSFEIMLKHPGFGKDNFQLAYYYAPLSYIRNFRDRGPYESRANPLVYHDFSYRSNSLGLAYWKKVSKKIDGKLQIKHSWRYFNQEFMENDNWEWRAGGYMTYVLSKRWKVRGEYIYSNAEGRGADEVGETLDNSDNSDPTYERDSYTAWIFFSPKGWIPKVGSLSLKGQHQIFYFKGDKALYEDPFHVGRKDKVSRVELAGKSDRFAYSMRLEWGYRFTRRTSTSPWTGGGDDSGIGEEKDYKENRFWIGVEYPF